MNTATIDPTELDDRITAAFSHGTTSDQVTSLISEVEDAADAASDAADRARSHALDPAVSSADVAIARRQMEDAAFRQERLHNAVTRLRERLRELQAQEKDQRRRMAYEKAREERDKLAAELKAMYPPIEAQLAELLPRIVANDREIEHINGHALPEGTERLLFAELIARGLPGWVQNSVEATRITAQLRLPAFEFDAYDPYTWPQRCNKGLF